VTWLSDAALNHLREVADRPDLTGTRYQIEAEIGRGGMGTVYRAHDRELDRPVALKVLTLEGELTGSAGDTAERLRREARILARLEHPGIVPVHDVLALPDGRVAYAMKWVRGRRLDEHVERGDEKAGLSLVERLRIFQRICEAVAFAHAQGVIHRDLKPANVMVGAFGEVLVMDWGVAKVLGSQPLPKVPGAPTAASDAATPGLAAPVASPASDAGTAHGTVLGTPGYMAPEQARGEVDAIDARADVYALGALLDFLLSTVRPAPPAPLAAIVDKARAEEPEERYPEVAALEGDVSRFLDGLAVTAYPEGPWRKTRRFVRRYRTPILLVLAYLVMRLLLFLFPPAG